jgi:gluconokinase
MKKSMALVVMGVSGCGKTTVGRLLAQRLDWPFFDADDLHSAENIEKMRRAIPLTDDDRASWLDTLANLLKTQLAAGQSMVLACSALRQVYREHIRGGQNSVYFIYLKGNYELILKRLQQRRGHYMPPAMLSSQFATLEEPEDALTIEINDSPAQITDQIIHELNNVTSG